MRRKLMRKNSVLSVLFAVLASLIFSVLVKADELSGKVVKVADGDTLTLLTPDKQQVRIRLAQIDAPEKAQPYGQKAKQALSDRVFGRTISVRVETTDRYGRTVGTVFIAGHDVNIDLVKGGHVWVYRQYAKDQDYYAAEEQAKKQKIGLWALQNDQRMPPWEWRKSKRN